VIKIPSGGQIRSKKVTPFARVDPLQDRDLAERCGFCSAQYCFLQQNLYGDIITDAHPTAGQPKRRTRHLFQVEPLAKCTESIKQSLFDDE